jgi:lysozyme
MRLSVKGKGLIQFYEGFRNRPYLCSAQVWTVGWGRVLYQEQIRLPVARVGDYTGMIRREFPLKAEDNRVWSKDEIEELFSQDVSSFERGALRLSPNLADRQGAFDAVVSFAFNAGLGNYQRSTIRMKNNRGDFEGAADAFMAWTKGGGKELPGLVKRRKDERALYLSFS